MSEDSVHSLMDMLDNDTVVELVAEEPEPVDEIVSCSDIDLPLLFVALYLQMSMI